MRGMRRTMHASFFRIKTLGVRRLCAFFKKKKNSRSGGGIVAIETEMEMMFEFGFIQPPPTPKKYMMVTLGLQSEVCRL